VTRATRKQGFCREPSDRIRNEKRPATVYWLRTKPRRVGQVLQKADVAIQFVTLPHGSHRRLTNPHANCSCQPSSTTDTTIRSRAYTLFSNFRRL
jgi:hypothetical protein